jgi:hypothetical protein
VAVLFQIGYSRYERFFIQYEFSLQSILVLNARRSIGKNGDESGTSVLADPVAREPLAFRSERSRRLILTHAPVPRLLLPSHLYGPKLKNPLMNSPSTADRLLNGDEPESSMILKENRRGGGPPVDAPPDELE